jgi:nitrogen fixation protein NifQ
MNEHSPRVSPPVPSTALHASNLDEASAARENELLVATDESPTPDARLFARLIAAREVRGEIALLGVTQNALDALFKRHFPNVAKPPRIPALPATLPASAHAHFLSALAALLQTHANPSTNEDDMRCIAAIVAHACLRPDHLWRDLGLSGRDDVTAMLERYFPTLVIRNTASLRWKKFLARELALARGTEPGPAPGCPGCEDFGYCFPHGH